jgi:hypothetical protein
VRDAEELVVADERHAVERADAAPVRPVTDDKRGARGIVEEQGMLPFRWASSRSFSTARINSPWTVAAWPVEGTYAFHSALASRKYFTGG